MTYARKGPTFVYANARDARWFLWKRFPAVVAQFRVMPRQENDKANEKAARPKGLGE
jgi:hypothetical protein